MSHVVSTALATRPARAKALARAWSTGLVPSMVRQALLEHAGVELRRVDAEDPFMHVVSQGEVFVDDLGDQLVAWRRPSPSWADAIRGGRQQVPYPDMLRLTVEPTPHGSRVVAHWQRHPLTKESARWLAYEVASVLALVWLSSVLPASIVGLLWFVLAVGFTVDVWRFIAQRATRRELLQAVHAALAPHELGEGSIATSVFRRAP